MIKTFEVKTSMLFNLAFANNTTLSCFSNFFLITDLYVLIAAVIKQTFNPIAEFVISIRILSKGVHCTKNEVFN